MGIKLNRLLMTYCYTHRQHTPSSLIGEVPFCRKWQISQRLTIGQGAETRAWTMINPKSVFLFLPPKVQGSLWRGSRKSLRVRGGGWLPGRGVFQAHQGSYTQGLTAVETAHTAMQKLRPDKIPAWRGRWEWSPYSQLREQLIVAGRRRVTFL